MARTSRPITVTLGELQERVESRVKSGAYASASEVMRAAVRALDREDAAIDDWLRERVAESLEDPRPNIPAETVFKELRKRHAANLKARRRGRNG
jgi:antitoxin ParD1/3/4